MENTAELDVESLLAQFGLDMLEKETLQDVRSALLAAYCAGIEAAERTED